MTKSPLLKKREVAERCGFSVSYVEALARNGKLPSIKFGPNCVRFSEEDVAAFIQRHVRGRRAESPSEAAR